MQRCPVCGAVNSTCGGHAVLAFPPVDLAPLRSSRTDMRKPIEPPRLVRPHVRPERGTAGYRHATVIEPGTEGIPVEPEVRAQDLGIPIEPDPPVRRRRSRKPKATA